MSNEVEQTEAEELDLGHLSDEELLEVMSDHLQMLYDLKGTEPWVTPEMIREAEEAFMSFKKSVAACEKADREVEISAEALNRAADKLLAFDILPDGKPISFVPPKKKGN